MAGYKINIRNCVAFIYVNKDLVEREIKKTSFIYNQNKRMKYLVYPENDKTMWKEIKTDLNKLRDIPCSWI